MNKKSRSFVPAPPRHGGFHPKQERSTAPGPLQNKEVKHNIFQSPLISIKTPPPGLRADSNYLVNLLEGPLFSPAPLQCQKHSVHLISSPRRANSKESVYWRKTEKQNWQLHKAPAYCQKKRRMLLQTIWYWIYGRRVCVSGDDPHYQSVPWQLCPDLLPWKIFFFFIQGLVLNWNSKSALLQSTLLFLLLSQIYHRSYGIYGFSPTSF